MKKTMIYMTERQQLLLKQRARDKGTSVAEVIRTAVDEFLLRERPQVDYMGIVGMAEGVRGDRTSERVDEALAEELRADAAPAGPAKPGVARRPAGKTGKVKAKRTRTVARGSGPGGKSARRGKS